eukprot:gene18861-25414_t
MIELAKRRSVQLAAAQLALCVLVFSSLVSGSSHKYDPNSQVTLWVNKVGPYNNPQETYNYHHLPFCKAQPGKKAEHSWGGLGEVLQGNELINSQLDINFQASASKQLICSQTLDASKAAQFEHAIKHAYWYELFLDDLPVWGFVGEIRHDSGGDVAYIYTHKTFDLSYNGDKIIQVNLTSDNPVAVVDGAQLEFTYSVNWVPSTIPFARRFERYLDYNFFEHKFFIFDSFIMVIFSLAC